ncbi:hypothetical protein DJ021_13725 [Phenylobacterium hankyongense]|uniref:Uncharacterized protein n=1 Tax=Phenylobacterium hankyongense TaxID=1813876 RepID=A0A328B091_9CAUL|nr:hypothetical protein [Phenylobacterium hankyongense]RAK60790.1 hypothetical protein DJ021_13725 [Phenylobacterium hankyongense]
MFKNAALAAFAAAVLAAPAAAAAQPYYSHPYGRLDRAQYDAPPRGDWYQGGRSRFRGYPEFRGVEAHIREEIVDGVRDDLIDRDDARDLMEQLHDIQLQEAREFRVHGWNLPEDDRNRIRAQLDQLDQLVDQIGSET